MLVGIKYDPAISLPGKIAPNGNELARQKQYVPIASAVEDTVLGALVQTEPLLVSTFPDVPGPTNEIGSEPLPTITALAVSDVTPVPPLGIVIGTPENARLIVPVVVTGLPVTVKLLGAVTATEVTDPAPEPPVVADNVPPTKLRLDPITTLLNPPLPLPDSKDVPLVRPLTVPIPGMSS